MERPKVTEDIVRKAATKVVNEYNHYNVRDNESLINDIVKHYRPVMSGYDLTKEVEINCGHVDSMFLEMIEGVCDEINNEHRRVCWIWIKKNNIQPSIPEGSEIKFGLYPKRRGIITGVDDREPGTYLVREIDQDENDKRRYLVKFEDAAAV